MKVFFGGAENETKLKANMNNGNEVEVILNEMNSFFSGHRHFCIMKYANDRVTIYKSFKWLEPLFGVRIVNRPHHNRLILIESCFYLPNNKLIVDSCVFLGASISPGTQIFVRMDTTEDVQNANEMNSPLI